MSLAVKYRPQTLVEVIGQEAIVKSINRILSPGCLLPSRSYLFIGPSGVGKTTLARIVANLLCGCKAEPSNLIEENAAKNSGKDDMSDLIARTQFRAIGKSPNKIVILDEAHALSSAAWECLLKPIEEPPSHVYWCICSTKLGKIPKTIQTRCVLYNLHPVDDVLIYDLLHRVSKSEGLGIDSEILETVAENSGGSPRQALTNLELCSAAKSANEARQLMRSGLKAKEAVDLAKLLMSRRTCSWAEAIKIINSMATIEAESIRIEIVNYIAGALLKAKSDAEAKHFLFILDCFSSEFKTSDRMAPLLVSVGLAMGLNQ